MLRELRLQGKSTLGIFVELILGLRLNELSMGRNHNSMHVVGGSCCRDQLAWFMLRLVVFPLVLFMANVLPRKVSGCGTIPSWWAALCRVLAMELLPGKLNYP